MRKKPICKKWQLNSADRLSDLPDEVLHHIISFLDFKDACRTCVLCKRWNHISDTNPVMDLFHDETGMGLFDETRVPKFDRFLEYTNRRMKRYGRQKLRIRKLRLGFPIRKSKFWNSRIPLENKGEEWVKIAVCNGVEELALTGPKNYVMSKVLLTAKSLRSLECCCVEIFDYEEGIVLFPSLESLFFDEVYVDEPMMNRIISSCVLLKHLRLVGLWVKSIVIPSSSKLETLGISNSLSREGIVTIHTSSLTSFQYMGDVRSENRPQWPVVSKEGCLRNLRMLKIGFVSITDDMFGKLLSELALLETLKICDCLTLKTIRISGATMLKEVRLEHCSDLLDISIDAPCLKTFKYKGDFKPAVSINSQVGCDISLHIPPCNFESFTKMIESFSKMKELVKGLKSCHVLKIVLLDDPANKDECADLELDDEDDLGDTHPGLPCDIRELKLTLSSWVLSQCYLLAFLEGVFWTCHPRMFSIRVNLKDPNLSIQHLVKQLKNMANCWNHPLKRAEVEGANCFDLLDTNKLDLQLILHW